MNVLSRDAWGASAPLGRPMRLPADELWVHHSVTKATGDVAADVRQIERIGVARFGRMSYSYVAHPTGVIAEGAGLTIGAHTAGRNSHALAVVAVGNYQTDRPTDALLEAIVDLADHLVERGALRPGLYPTGGHRDAPGAKTACPGDHLYAALPDLRHPVAIPPAPPAVFVPPYVLKDGTVRHLVTLEPDIGELWKGWVPGSAGVSATAWGPYRYANDHAADPTPADEVWPWLRLAGTITMQDRGPTVDRPFPHVAVTWPLPMARPGDDVRCWLVVDD